MQEQRLVQGQMEQARQEPHSRAQNNRSWHCTGNAAWDCRVICAAAAPSSHRTRPVGTRWESGSPFSQKSHTKSGWSRPAERQKGGAERSLFGRIEFLTDRDIRRGDWDWQHRSLTRLAALGSNSAHQTHGHMICVRQDVFAQFDADTSRVEFSEHAGRHFCCERFDELAWPFGRERL